MFVKVDKFIYPVDFMVLDIGNDNKFSLILGRSILAIGRALIDVEAGCLMLRMDNEKVYFHKFHSTKLYEVEPMCNEGEVDATLAKAIRVAKLDSRIQQKELTKPLSMTIHLRLYLKRLKRNGTIPNTPIAPTPIPIETHKKKQRSTVEIIG